MVSEHLFHCRHHFHRQEAFRPSPSRQPHCRLGQVRAALCRKRTSHVQVFQVRPQLCHSTFLWRLACEISQQVHSISASESNLVTFEPRVMMDEIGKVRIVHDFEMTSIVQLHSFSGTPKQRVLTQNVELARPVSGCCRRPKYGQ